MKQTSLLDNFITRQTPTITSIPSITPSKVDKSNVSEQPRKSIIKKNKKMVLDSDDNEEANEDSNKFLQYASSFKTQKERTQAKFQREDLDNEEEMKISENKIQRGSKKKSVKLKMKPEAENEENQQKQDDQFGQFTDATPYWARSESCRDANMRAPDHPEYDPTTLYIPNEAWAKFTAPMKQFWKIKQSNYDKIILFKLGKFYELFYDDAAVGNKYMNLKFMGTKMHAGFPEKMLEKYTNEFVRLGFKTVIVEQMETPDQMNARVKEEKLHGRKSEKTLNREVTQILTKGTVPINDDDGEVAYLPNYLLSLRIFGDLYAFSLLEIGSNEIVMGIVDQLEKFKTVLYQTRPVEAVYDPDNVPFDLLTVMEKSFLQMQLSKLYNKNNVWHPLTALCEIEKLQKEGIMNRPKIMKVIDQFPETNKNLLYSTLSGMFDYLKKVFKFEYVIGTVRFNFFEKDKYAKNMILDSQALQHLQIFETSEGENGSLFKVIDRTKTKFGRRLLRRWIMAPLMNTFHIHQRLNAVEDLQQISVDRERVGGILKKLPDLDKKVNKLYHYAIKTTSASKAIYFEDLNTARLKQFRQIMEKMEEAYQAISILAKSSHKFKSLRLKQLVNCRNSPVDDEEVYQEDEDDQSTLEGLLPDVTTHLEQFKSYVKWVNNAPIPQKGLVSYFDELQDQLEQVKGNLNEYLQKMRYEMNEPNLKFVHTKERFEIEIPEKSEKRRPKDFEFSSKRAGFSRYVSPVTKQYVKKIEKVEESIKDQMGHFIGFFFEEFKKKQKIWEKFVAVLAEIDCLISLSEYSFLNKKVRPTFQENTMEIIQAKHPCLTHIQFIPNDIIMDRKVMLLTGPNMGGKSTILRTVCTLAILAQIGCYVPAQKYDVQTIDRVFTRIGASDKLELGKSTFFIEMEETKNVLIHGTRKSLAIIDQLGRGTSTFDGLAIAYSVLKNIIQQIKCYCIFATHYHILVQQFRKEKEVQLKMMDSLIKDERIIFLYKLVKGSVGKSFGLNVARKIGIDEQIIAIAEIKSTEMNEQIEEKRLAAFDQVQQFLKQ